MLSKHIFQNGLLASKLLSFLREVKFGKQEFFASKPIFNIKYHHPGSQNNNYLSLFNNQLDYIPANHLAEFDTTKNRGE